nr:immunoglobulin heavy chain junction region [Mus musculus]
CARRGLLHWYFDVW